MHAINFCLERDDALSGLEALAVVNSVQAETFDFLEAVVMLSPFAEAIASRREIACSAVSDFAATKIQSGVVCAAWGAEGVFPCTQLKISCGRSMPQRA